ncbi:MAG: hypothetical protein GX347_08505 [Epulopiscium sp.]|nr:hypothetical protein [Candidatus Epulonipiscium sp.]
MPDFIRVIMQILAISGVQIIVEGILKQWGRTEMIKIVNLLCYIASFYIVWQFFDTYIIKGFQEWIRILH